jgi:hypothetical protein
MKKYHQMLKKSINKKACENYLLMIPIRKVALWNKNVKTMFQEVLSRIYVNQPTAGRLDLQGLIFFGWLGPIFIPLLAPRSFLAHAQKTNRHLLYLVWGRLSYTLIIPVAYKIIIRGLRKDEFGGACGFRR